MAGIDDIYVDPNAGAYEKDETRFGPPLTYVAEKLRASLESLHSLCSSIKTNVSDNSARPAGNGSSFTAKNDALSSQAYIAFHYELIGFLALQNFLGVAGDHGLVDRLLSMAQDDFKSWLDSIELEGSVTG